MWIILNSFSPHLDLDLFPPLPWQNVCFLVGFYPCPFRSRKFFLPSASWMEKKAAPEPSPDPSKARLHLWHSQFRWGSSTKPDGTKPTCKYGGFPSKLVVSTNPFGKTYARPSNWTLFVKGSSGWNHLLDRWVYKVGPCDPVISAVMGLL